ncbi:hypothetical protein B9G69_013720 [Bdellovibrio sp. SKB1291214]|uniref:hypothetical protein n=1 Tax=Bdellovibrio sp. SKB1291214 TaxID=1732569 RepID=UPI000B516AE2|nr:hypothetical protein [Bdellovibrio sp. SKB1291214]UYL08104.1 hypothetical protein B9G69_013720 [Bdellovibrio sp. SKB1291214]
MRLSSLAIYIVILFSFAASAKEQERASLEVDDKMFLGDVVVKKGTLKKDQLEVRGFKIQESSVDEVAKKYKAKVYETGEGDDALYLVCLIGSDNAILEYTSGEMGGTENTLLTVSLHKNTVKYTYKKHCTKVDKAFMKQRVAGLKIGMKEDAIVKHLGEPSKKTPTMVLYYYEDKKKIKGVDFQINSVIHTRLSNGKIISISVTQVMNY